jgi:hypothetical protein
MVFFLLENLDRLSIADSVVLKFSLLKRRRY